MNLEWIQPGDLVYGPFPAQIIKNRMKASHYCLVLSVDNKTGLFLAAIGTSGHIDSCSLDHELLIVAPDDLRRAKLRKPTRFDLLQTAWLDAEPFAECGNIRFSSGLIYAFSKAANAAGLV